ncbi:putative DNA damage repair protein Mus42 [Aspergillus steynii IBT 23096]|uniref:DNA repair protein REV1 n=1 Tax=Aspergillus steynii IBT 23096 TaxID=1392250 RepID=A0A2I2GR86_9EURO|nr:putative DNA damage repair protein Mus42 [Aspergillus steynii IBT 23096]PLB55373.1 putative DNA damage repair protein Mus42 [Aspergillus steynii IBT 23096]
MGSTLDANSSAVRKRIENHHFEDEEGEEYGASAFGGFSDYMRRKKIKLQNLDAEIRSSAADCPPIFRGVVAHVNGYTQPSLQDLHRLIVSHGGGFLQYLDGKTAATHIIASSLTPKKREEFRRYRIVKPAWIVESVKAGRMLPWDAFRVVDEGQSQKVLKFDSGHFTSQTNSPQSGYKDQTNSSWYTEQLKSSANANSSGLKPLSPGSPTPSHVLSQSIKESQSDYGDFPSFASLDEPTENTSLRKTHELANTVDSLETDATAQNSIAPRSPPPPDNDQSNVTPSRAVPRSNMTSEEYNAQLLSDERMKSSSVVNPEFLQQYYKESRLHHLSTWKAELKAQLQSAAKEKSQSRVGQRRHAPGARRYIMHVDFDCFFAAVSTLQHPEFEGKPVAVAHGSGSGSEIASCNYAARAHGVKNGMWMKGALQSCPDLKVVPYDFPAYEEASRKFYSAILAIDGIVQSVSIDEALVDITSQCLETGGTDGKGVSEGSIYREQAKAEEIAQVLRISIKDQTGCAVSVGIGGNILQAKVALRKAKPAGQFQLKPDAVLDFIGNLPVQNLPGVGYSLGTKLEEIGVKFVKDINDLSRERLTSTLGPKTGIKMWEYARGIDRTEVGNEVMRKSVSAEVNWGIRFVNQTQAEDFVTSLCGELHRRLVENLVKGKQLTLKVMRRSADAPLEPVKHLGHGKCDVFNKSIVLGIATNEAEVLAKEANSMLRGFGVSPGDLRGLGVQMTKLEPLSSSTSGRLESSQKRLTFKASPVRKPMEQSIDPDNLNSPRKGDSESVSHGPSLNDSAHKPLNISGSQFIMPSQPDPKVVAELPNDIRSKLVAQGKRRRDSRSVSPSPISRQAPRQQPQSAATELPPQSQLDPETLAALPEDVRAEVLGYYNPPSENSDVQYAPAPVEPSRPSSSGSLKFKKPTTPIKKRRGRPSLKPSDNLMQSKFLFPKATTSNRPDISVSQQLSPSEDTEEVSAEFLAALPEDIRREVLEEHRRARMLQRSTNGSTAVPRAAPARNLSAPIPQTQEPRLQLPPLPERPTFTSLKLSSLPDLRETVDSWHAAFAEDGPFDEDVNALSGYLKRVVADEKDIDKAVSVVKWLMWLVDDAKGNLSRSSDTSSLPGPSGSSQNVVPWDDAVRSLQQSIQDGLEERDLPPFEFS